MHKTINLKVQNFKFKSVHPMSPRGGRMHEEGEWKGLMILAITFLKMKIARNGQIKILK